MASWRDRLKEIELEPFRDSGETAKSVKTAKSAPFDTYDTFGSPSEIPAAGFTATPTRLGADEPEQLRHWRAGLQTLDPDRPPNGYPSELWHQMHRDGIAFLSTWGAQAAALGWSTLDLFGVHRFAPAANYSAVGLVPLLRGSTVVALTADEASIIQTT